MIHAVHPGRSPVDAARKPCNRDATRCAGVSEAPIRAAGTSPTMACMRACDAMRLHCSSREFVHRRTASTLRGRVGEQVLAVAWGTAQSELVL